MRAGLHRCVCCAGGAVLAFPCCNTMLEALCPTTVNQSVCRAQECLGENERDWRKCQARASPSADFAEDRWPTEPAGFLD